MSLSDSRMMVKGHLNRKISNARVDKRNFDILGPFFAGHYQYCHERVANKTTTTGESVNKASNRRSKKERQFCGWRYDRGWNRMY